MAKRGRGKDIAGKVVNFLREKGGKAVISTRKDAGPVFDCSSSPLNYSLNRLIDTGVIKVLGQLKRGVREPAELSLSNEFIEGDDWRKALKRKSSGNKSETRPSVVAKPSRRLVPPEVSENKCQSEECLKTRRVLLEQLVETFETLKASQEEGRVLRSTVVNLQKELENLRSEAEKKGKACRQLRDDVEGLESRLRMLRTQTSQPPPSERKLMFDSSGVMVLPGEGLPDRS